MGFRFSRYRFKPRLSGERIVLVLPNGARISMPLGFDV